MNLHYISVDESYKKASVDQERKAAPRHRTNLKSSVLITAIRNSAEGKESYLVLQAQLLDVSLTGLALIVSDDDMRELEMFGNDYLMRLLLPLPVEAIELEAIPARYQQLDETEKSKFLIGTHITNMKGRDRILFMDFIHESEPPTETV